MYTSTYLADAHNYIEAIADKIKDRIVKKPELNDYYIELFDKVAASKGKQQGSWAYCFTEGELLLLADYIFSEHSKSKTEEEIQAMLAVFCKSENTKHINILYKEWQNHFEEPRYAGIFHMIYEVDGYRAFFQDEYDVNVVELDENVRLGKTVEYFNHLAGQLSDGAYVTYCKRLQECGIDENTLLYKECINMYALVCDGKAYVRMGVEVVKDFMRNLVADARIRMMQNMLKVLDSFQLKMFVSIVPLFREYVGEYDSETYRLIINPLSKAEKDKYVLWQNQFLIFEILGEGERSEFWMSYADKSIIAKHNRANVIFLTFAGFTVIEFEKGEAAYFFNNEYMKEKVEPLICDMENEADIEDCIYNNTEWSLDKTHKDHWRKAHLGTWQLDMKSYMSRNLVSIYNNNNN